MRRAGDIQIKQLPCRIESIDKAAPDVAIVRAQAAGERAAAIPRRPVHRLPAEGRPPAQLLARDAAARRRAARAAHPPRARRLVHRPGVHDVQGPRDPALRGAARHVLPARGFRQADRSSSPAAPASRRSRRSSSTRSITGSTARDGALLGRAREARSLPARPARASGSSRASELHVHPGAVGTRCRRCVARPHGLRAPGRDGRLSATCRATRSMRAARRR